MNFGWLKTPSPLWKKLGLLIPEDAATVAHIYFDGAKLNDTKGNTWTQVGTVPQVAKSGAVPAGAGPFSGSNYYSAGNALEQHASFSIVALVTVANSGTDQQIISKDDAGAQRNYEFFNYGTAANGSSLYIFKTGGNSFETSGAGNPTNAVHLFMMSYNYTADGSSNLRLGQDATQAAIANAVGPPATSSSNHMLGRRDNATQQPWTGYIHELQIWSRALSSAELTAIYNSIHAKGVV